MICSTKFTISKTGSREGNEAPARIAMNMIERMGAWLTTDKGVKVNKVTSKSYGSYILYFPLDE